jgi:hypothetical protein
MRRGFWPAAQAGAKTTFRRLCCIFEIQHIFFSRRPGRTNGATVYACGFYRDKELPVESWVTGKACTATNFRVYFIA